MIDMTVEIFKGDLCSIKEVMESYSLKEISEFRDVRVERKKKEEDERKEEEAREAKRREFREQQAAHRRR
jgi:hypothetical protein